MRVVEKPRAVVNGKDFDTVDTKAVYDAIMPANQFTNFFVSQFGNHLARLWKRPKPYNRRSEAADEGGSGKRSITCDECADLRRSSRACRVQ